MSSVLGFAAFTRWIADVRSAAKPSQPQDRPQDRPQDQPQDQPLGHSQVVASAETLVVLAHAGVIDVLGVAGDFKITTGNA